MSLMLVLAVLLAVSTTYAQEISQTTHGWCSPAVADTQGNVTINCHGVDPRALDRLNELLDKKDLELEEKIQEANQWVEKYNELLASAADDPELQELIRRGDLDEAGRILDARIESKEDVVGAAAADNFMRATIFELQIRRLDALPHYEKAYRYRPENIEYAFAYATALQRQKRFRQSEAIYEEVLTQQRRLAEANPEAYLPHLAATLNNLGLLYFDPQPFRKGGGGSSQRSARLSPAGRGRSATSACCIAAPSASARRRQHTSRRGTATVAWPRRIRRPTCRIWQ